MLNGAQIINQNINCLIYADDLLLISTNASGLQNSLNRLQQYCNTWNLKVNVQKIKVMIFNPNGHLLDKKTFQFNTGTLEIVQNYIL
jgi:hypothetical protein